MEDQQKQTQKSRGLIWLFIPLFTIFIVQSMCAIFGEQVLLLVTAGRFSGSTLEEFGNDFLEATQSTGFTMAVLFLYSIICAALFYHWYRKFYLIPEGRSIKASLAKWKEWNLPMVIIGTLAFTVGFQYISAYLITLLSMVNPSWLETYEDLLSVVDFSVSGPVLAILILYAIFLGPVTEELAFRGLTLRFGKESMPFWAANILQAFFFGVIHGNIIQGVYAFILGFCFGWLAHEADSILLPILLHILYNTAGTVLSSFTTVGQTQASFFGFLLAGITAAFFGFELIRQGIGMKVFTK